MKIKSIIFLFSFSLLFISRQQIQASDSIISSSGTDVKLVIKNKHKKPVWIEVVSGGLQKIVPEKLRHNKKLTIKSHEPVTIYAWKTQPKTQYRNDIGSVGSSADTNNPRYQAADFTKTILNPAGDKNIITISEENGLK